MADLTAEQARALAAPTRRAILAHLAEADERVTVAQLSERLGLNHNGVRKHLDRLVASGLVLEELETRATPGRPRLLYRSAPSHANAAEPSYRRLAVMLAKALVEGANPVAIGRAAALSDATSYEGTSPLDALVATFEAGGFQPTVRRRGRRADIVLGECPFVDAAVANPVAVCQLHLGLAEGAAGAIGGLAVEGLAAKDPRRAGCRLTVTETTAGEP